MTNAFSITDLTDEELARISLDIHKEQEARKETSLYNRLEEMRQTWVGRYFKDSYTSSADGRRVIEYYKIVNERAESEFRVSALCFPLEPRFEFVKHGGFKSLYGDMRLISVETKSVKIEELTRMEEIKEREFKSALGNHFLKLEGMEFEVD